MIIKIRNSQIENLEISQGVYVTDVEKFTTVYEARKLKTKKKKGHEER